MEIQRDQEDTNGYLGNMLTMEWTNDEDNA